MCFEQLESCRLAGPQGQGMDGEGGAGGLPGPLQTGVGKPEAGQVQGKTPSSNLLVLAQ